MAVPILDWAPASVVVFGAIVALASQQGGYFPPSWGPTAFGLLAIVVVFLAFGLKSDIGRHDVAFLALLALFIAWVALSYLWSGAPAQTVLEVQRDVVLLAGLAAILLLARAHIQAHLALAVAAAIVTVSGYGLATRLFPADIGWYEPYPYRLSQPIGYWNGLGILAAIGIILAVGIALEGSTIWERLLAPLALVILGATLYFTFSRGAWMALIAGLVGMFATSNRRLATLGGAIVLLPGPLLAVILSSRAEGLTRWGTSLAIAQQDGLRTAWALALCLVVAAASAVVLLKAQDRISLDPTSRRVVGRAVIVAAAAAVVPVILIGGPVTMVERAVHSFDTPLSATDEGANLNQRLLRVTGTGRTEIWRVAATTYEHHKALGSGAGSFERYWQQDPRLTIKVTDAHSLYLEVLAELGPIGLILLSGALAIPLAACLAMRRGRLIPAATGAYLAYLVHAGIDWDWELPAITLAALVTGSLGIVAARTGRPRPLDSITRGSIGVLVAAAAVLVVVGYLGNYALDRSHRALARGDLESTVAQSRTGSRWMPWSPGPPTVRGEALLQLNRVGEAKAAFEEAIDLDAGYWRAWLGLAVASSGAARDEAMVRAKALYPMSIEIEKTEELLAQSG